MHELVKILRGDRLPECSFDDGRTWETDDVIVAETFARCADLIEKQAAEIRGLRAAINWLDGPFIDSATSRDELVSRIKFMRVYRDRLSPTEDE